MKFLKTILVAGTAALSFGIGAADAAVLLNFGAGATSSNPTPTGASATALLSFVDEGGDVRVSAEVTNTTGSPIFGAGATESMLTGFGLDLVPGATYVADSFIGGTYLDTLILDADASPFGTLDIAGADNDQYNGGNANGALPQPLSDTFSFLLSSLLGASDLEDAFLTAFTTDPVLTSAVRFQQVNAGAGSDKLTNPDVPNPIPLPAAGLLLFAGLGGLGAFRAVRRAA